MIRMVRLAVTAVSVAGAIAAILRTRGGGGVPPQAGGWREVIEAELR